MPLLNRCGGGVGKLKSVTFTASALKDGLWSKLFIRIPNEEKINGFMCVNTTSLSDDDYDYFAFYTLDLTPNNPVHSCTYDDINGKQVNNATMYPCMAIVCGENDADARGAMNLYRFDGTYLILTTRIGVNATTSMGVRNLQYSIKPGRTYTLYYW